MSESAATLWSVVIGAMLATVGGFAATQMEGILRRRERERSAALLFGEILTALELITRIANESRGRGDPYGPFTMRLLRGVRRETDTYDRNREQLYDLRDPTTRAQIHGLMVRITLALDGVTDAAEQIGILDGAASGLAEDDPMRRELAAQRAIQAEARHAAFDFMVDGADQIKPIIGSLGPLSKQSFEKHEAVMRG
ncbi:hypothetical protein [Phenylobacterium sp.]|uniref:hypothetical protein n=1 Tax=Phenylobacterium sp. TaxID=1871053 RepID=UPI00121104F3|nr:hypothetical protein [Phenylobacterium sp.]THD55550.1 MAG: hypothetical protein E8A12_16040 [Phenylobacterium sp.]